MKYEVGGMKYEAGKIIFAVSPIPMVFPAPLI